MAAKAVNARKRPDRNKRFRGHGPLPTRTRGTCPPPVAHARGDIQGALPLLVLHAALPPRAIGPRGGPWPRKRWMEENVSIGATPFEPPNPKTLRDTCHGESARSQAQSSPNPCCNSSIVSGSRRRSWNTSIAFSKQGSPGTTEALQERSHSQAAEPG